MGETTEWVALAVVGVIAYVACAGTARRMWRVPNSGACQCTWGHTWDERYRLSEKCAKCCDDSMFVGAVLWPIVLAWRLVNVLVRSVIVLPIRATFRIASGDTDAR